MEQGRVEAVVSLDQLGANLMSARMQMAYAEVHYNQNPISRLLHKDSYHEAQSTYQQAFEERLSYDLNELRQGKKGSKKLNAKIKSFTADVLQTETAYRLELEDAYRGMRRSLGSNVLSALGLGKERARTIEQPALPLSILYKAEGYETQASQALLAADFIHYEQPERRGLRARVGRVAVGAYLRFSPA